MSARAELEGLQVMRAALREERDKLELRAVQTRAACDRRRAELNRLAARELAGRNPFDERRPDTEVTLTVAAALVVVLLTCVAFGAMRDALRPMLWPLALVALALPFPLNLLRLLKTKRQ